MEKIFNSEIMHSFSVSACLLPRFMPFERKGEIFRISYSRGGYFTRIHKDPPVLADLATFKNS